MEATGFKTNKGKVQYTANKDTNVYHFGAMDFPPFTTSFSKGKSIAKGTVINIGGQESIDNVLYYIDADSLLQDGGGYDIYLASDFSDNISSATSSEASDTSKSNNLIIYGLIGVVATIIAYNIYKNKN